jgi:hypothetical protein
MGDEDVRDLASPDLVPDHLYLRPFAAVNKKKIAIHCDDLAGWMPIKSRNCRIVSQDGYSEHARNYDFGICTITRNAAASVQFG